MREPRRLKAALRKDGAVGGALAESGGESPLSAPLPLRVRPMRPRGTEA